MGIDVQIRGEVSGKSLELLQIAQKILTAVVSQRQMSKEALEEILAELDQKIGDLIVETSGQERIAICDLRDRLESLIKRLNEAEILIPVDPEKVKEFYAMLTGASPDAGEIICLECGATFRSLRVHLRRAHGLSQIEYREKHDLDPETPLVCEALRKRGAANGGA